MGELKYYGRRAGRDKEMYQWWQFHSRRSEHADLLRAESLDRPKVLARSKQSLVVCNVYDVMDSFKVFNKVAGLFGSGAYHAGIEVFDREISFGGFEPDYEWQQESGLIFCGPRQCEAHSYRESLILGRTECSSSDVDVVVSQMEGEWPGGSYNLLENNCCHFSDAFAQRLGMRPLPRWIFNLAATGAGVARTINEGIESRGVPGECGYQFGDFTRGVVSCMVTEGKSSRGVSKEQPYQFGDLTRGILSRIGAACSAAPPPPASSVAAAATPRQLGDRHATAAEGGDVNAEKLQLLKSMGFGEDVALSALGASGGDLERAIGILVAA